MLWRSSPAAWAQQPSWSEAARALSVPRERARLEAEQHPAGPGRPEGAAAPREKEAWGFVAANGSAWSGCKLAVEGSMVRGPQVWFLSEHRLRAGVEQVQAEAWAKARGLGLLMHSAASTGDGPLHTSSGIAVAIRGGAMCKAPDWEEWVDWALREGCAHGDSAGYESARVRARILARVCPVRVKGLLRGGFVAIAIHLVDGLRFEGANGIILRLLSGFLSQLKGAWVVGGDWNMTPSELGQCGFLSHVGGSVRVWGESSTISWLGRGCRAAFVRWSVWIQFRRRLTAQSA